MSLGKMRKSVTRSDVKNVNPVSYYTSNHFLKICFMIAFSIRVTKYILYGTSYNMYLEVTELNRDILAMAVLIFVECTT